MCRDPATVDPGGPLPWLISSRFSFEASGPLLACLRELLRMLEPTRMAPSASKMASLWPVSCSKRLSGAIFGMFDRFHELRERQGERATIELLPSAALGCTQAPEGRTSFHISRKIRSIKKIRHRTYNRTYILYKIYYYSYYILLIAYIITYYKCYLILETITL